MQMTCTILHSGKQNQYIIHRKKKIERKSCFLFYSTALCWASNEHPQKTKEPPHCSLHMYISLTIPLKIFLSIRCNDKSERSHCISFDVTLKWWNLLPPWADCMKMNRGSLPTVSLNWPQTDVLIPAFTSPIGSRLSLDGERLSSIHRLQCSASEASSVCWWQRGEQHAWGEVKAKVGGTGRCWGGEWKSIIYTDCLPGWLSIRNCKSFPLYLALLPPLPLSTPPVLSADSEIITKPKNRQRRLTTRRNTRLKMTKHVQPEIIQTHPPILDSSYFSVSLPAPRNLHTNNMPLSKKHSDMNWKEPLHIRIFNIIYFTKWE